MSRKNSFKNNNKKTSKVKRNTYSNNNVSLVKSQSEKEENKKVSASLSNDQQQTPDNSQSKYIMIISFACLGFIFTFLANLDFLI